MAPSCPSAQLPCQPTLNTASRPGPRHPPAPFLVPGLMSVGPCHLLSDCASYLHPTFCPRILRESSNLGPRQGCRARTGHSSQAVLTAPHRKALTWQVSADPTSPWRLSEPPFAPSGPPDLSKPHNHPLRLYPRTGCPTASSPGGERCQHLRVKPRAGGSPWMCPQTQAPRKSWWSSNSPHSSHNYSLGKGGSGEEGATVSPPGQMALI